MREEGICVKKKEMNFDDLLKAIHIKVLKEIK